MMNIITIIISSIVESITSCMLIKTYMKDREYVHNRWIHVSAIIILAGMIALSNNFFRYGVYNAIGMIASVFIISYVYQGKTIVRLVLSVSSVCLAVYQK